MEAKVLKTKNFDRRQAVSESWQIRQNGKTVLFGDPVFVRIAFRNLCRKNFSCREYDPYMVFPLQNIFETGSLRRRSHYDRQHRGINFVFLCSN
jgi:hypothetical protein